MQDHVTRYSVMPIPPIEAHTRYFEAGNVRIGVEYRVLAAAVAAAAVLETASGDDCGPRGIRVVSFWPGLVLTERLQPMAEADNGLDFSKAESSRFTGRAVATLAQHTEAQSYNGTAVSSRQIADAYGFKDVGGSLPDGPLEHRPSGGLPSAD